MKISTGVLAHCGKRLSNDFKSFQSYPLNQEPFCS